MQIEWRDTTAYTCLMVRVLVWFGASPLPYVSFSFTFFLPCLSIHPSKIHRSEPSISFLDYSHFLCPSSFDVSHVRPLTDVRVWNSYGSRPYLSDGWPHSLHCPCYLVSLTCETHFSPTKPFSIFRNPGKSNPSSGGCARWTLRACDLGRGWVIPLNRQWITLRPGSQIASFRVPSFDRLFPILEFLPISLPAQLSRIISGVVLMMELWEAEG